MKDNSNRILVIIPTRNRVEYLSLLLGSLFHQVEKDFDILILNSGDVIDLSEIYSRLGIALHCLGHTIFERKVDVLGLSEVAAVNTGMFYAVSKGYGFIYKIDDDHIVPPEALKVFKEKLLEKEKQVSKGVGILISGVTPWVVQKSGIKNAYGPQSKFMGEPKEFITRVKKDKDGNISIDPRHFMRFPEAKESLYETELASAANFFMRPDLSIQWTDSNGSSLLADAVWFLQLRKFLKYKLYFDLKVEVWHLVATIGGVHEEGVQPQESTRDKERKHQFDLFYKFIEF